MNNPTHRSKCYKCYRPHSSCICSSIKVNVKTNTKFVILMHPKEYKKTKNGTGHMTKNSIENCELFVGIDFTNHQRINSLINDSNYEAFVLYPGDDSINLSDENLITDKKLLIFIIDSTWPCSKKMLRLSENLQKLRKISFSSCEISNFRIKTQPQSYCLSTIESTRTLLRLLNEQKIESISKNQLDKFLTPFDTMVDYQLEFTKKVNKNIRFKETKKI